MKREIVLLFVLIGLCSLAGCGGKRLPELPAPPVILNLPDCPAPDRPRLPQVNGGLPFDAPENINTFLERDDIMRAYIKGLEAAVLCARRDSIQGESEND